MAWWSLTSSHAFSKFVLTSPMPFSSVVHISQLFATLLNSSQLFSTLSSLFTSSQLLSRLLNSSQLYVNMKSRNQHKRINMWKHASMELPNPGNFLRDLRSLRNEEKIDQTPSTKTARNSLWPPRIWQSVAGAFEGVALDIAFLMRDKTKISQAKNYQLQKRHKKAEKKTEKKTQIPKNRTATSLKVECSVSNSYFLQQFCFQMQNIPKPVHLLENVMKFLDPNKPLEKWKHLEISRIWILQE